MPRVDFDGVESVLEEVRQVVFADSPHHDAFGRLRVSNSHMLLSSVLDYDKRPLLWGEALTGSGSITFDADSRTLQLDVGTTSGDEVIRQTKEYFTYRAGQSQLAVMTACFASPKQGLRQRVGYFDGDNGIFLELSDAGEPTWVIRSKSSGSVLDTDRKGQSEWSLTYLDGDDETEPTLDLTKTQILVIDLQWLGAGRVRCGFEIDGVPHYTHYFHHANRDVTTYMGTGTLPCRYEITNTDTTASASQLLQICSSVVREGGDEEPGPELSADMGITAYTATTTLTTMLGIRVASTHTRIPLAPVLAKLFNVGINPVRWALSHNPTTTGSGTFAALKNSAAEKSVSQLPVTDEGTLLASGYVPGGQAGRGALSAANLAEAITIVADIAGVSDIVWLSVQSTTGTSDMLGVIAYREFR